MNRNNKFLFKSSITMSFMPMRISRHMEVCMGVE